MPILFPANLYSVETELMCEDVPCTIKQNYRAATGFVADYPAFDLVDAYVANVVPKLLDLLASTIVVMRVIGRCCRPIDGIPYEANFTEAEMGTGSAEPLPPSIAALIKFRTSSGYSRNNGHLYIPGIPEDVWINGAWDSGFVTLVGAFGVAAVTPLVGASITHIYQPCVVSRFLNNVERVTAATFDISDFSLSPRISQQRRRQSGQQGIKA